MAYIRIINGKGVHLVFDNGCTLSIQFGPGSYSDNYDMPISEEGYRLAGRKGSATAEIAIWDKDKRWYSFDKDTFDEACCDVKRHVPIADVIGWIDRVQGMKP